MATGAITRMKIATGHCALTLTLTLTLALVATLSGPLARAEAKPQEVRVGVYILDVYDLDIKTGTYRMEFYIWFNWRGSVDPRRFEIMNGHLELRQDPDFQVFGEDRYISYRCRALLREHFDLRRYPWDEQVLSLELEDASQDATQLVYVADIQNSIVDAELSSLHDWQVEPGNASVRTMVYPTTYGNPRRGPHEQTVYSRFSMAIPIRHCGIETFIKTFLPLFISVAISMLVFGVKPSSAESRFVIGVAALFGAVSSAIVVSDRLPDTSYFTMVDNIHNLGMFFVFLSLLQSCIAYWLHHTERTHRGEQLDFWSALAFPLAFIAAVLLIVGRLCW
jgi:hypothetical protein